MVTKVQVKGMQEFDEFYKGIDPKGPPVLFYFTGAKLPTGKSWCSDCNDAEPIVEAYLTEVKKSLIFVYVDVGDRETFKKTDCPFRTDSRTRIMVIPTIIRWKGVQRLEGEQCCKRELLQMLLEDEEE
ncbi:thioredoxin domain-containing protein 17-like [Anticarsia gemmatalis]|uniref:thioredoxin domain-containing protein 17-like n=1 Tax=Anticarsia gemmatalis TaxID=129554 RepID=UPI003F75B0EF